MNKSILTPGILAASFLAFFGCVQTAFAARLVDIAIVNRNTGERLTPYRHEGKIYVAGAPGDRYAVELKSLRGERLLTVLSVDGVNVITGETAAALQSGYVIDGWQRHAVNGWRKNMEGIAQFVFTALADSYAARTGRPDNVGVIGVAVYREKIVPPPAAPVTLSPYSPSVKPWRAESGPQLRTAPARDAHDGVAGSAMPAPASAAQSGRVVEAQRSETEKSRASSPAQAAKESTRLGTGHGEREYSPMKYTEFERNSDAPDETITLYYDSRANLIARGIIKSPRRLEPNPFPASAGFVPDPHG